MFGRWPFRNGRLRVKVEREMERGTEHDEDRDESQEHPEALGVLSGG